MSGWWREKKTTLKIPNGPKEDHHKKEKKNPTISKVKANAGRVRRTEVSPRPSSERWMSENQIVARLQPAALCDRVHSMCVCVCDKEG